MATSFSSSSLSADTGKNAYCDPKINNNNNFYIQNTPYLLKSDKSDVISGADVLQNSRIDFSPGNLKKDEYFKNFADRNDFTDKIDFFRGTNLLNSDLYRPKSPSSDYTRNYPDIYGKSDAKSEYFRHSVAEYYKKNPNDFYFRNEVKSPDYLKNNSDLFRVEPKRTDTPKNGEKSPGLDFLRPKSPKDDIYKQKIDSIDFRRKNDGFRKDTDGDFLKPNCDFGKQQQQQQQQEAVYNEKSDYYSEVNNKQNDYFNRKSPEYFRSTDEKNTERCSVISNHSDNSHLSTNSTEISHLRLKINEESDFLPRESAVNGVMNIVNASISGYHAASSSPPISGEMKYMPPGQHHHHHHHHHQVSLKISIVFFRPENIRKNGLRQPSLKLVVVRGVRIRFATAPG